METGQAWASMAALVALLLAGCASAPSSPAPGEPAASDTATGTQTPASFPGVDAPAGFSYACPGPATPGAPVCSTLLLSQGHVLAEPFLAQDPTHDGTYAVAANTRGSPADQALVGVALFVSRDAGASWTTASLPALPPGRSAADSVLGDPALAFRPDGALAFGSLLCTLDGLCSIVAALSTDLGASWSPWTVVSGGEAADREWLTALPDGTLLADWTAGGSGVSVVSSADGLSWSDATRISSCIGASPVEVVAGRPAVACVDFDGQAPQGVRLVQADGNGAWSTWHDQAGLKMVWPRVLPGPSGPVLVLEDYGNSSVALRAWDGGLGGGAGDWGPLVDVGQALTVDDGWTRTFCHAEAVDAWGRVHLVVGGEPAGPLAGPPDRNAMAYAHAVFDGGRLVHEQALTPDPPRQLAQGPAGQVVVSSDYAGLVLDGGSGMLVWPEMGGLSVTRLAMG